jgi:hypothetical protein
MIPIFSNRILTNWTEMMMETSHQMSTSIFICMKMTTCLERYKGVSAKKKVPLLLPLLSIDRSRDMNQFNTTGIIIANILGNNQEALSLWKSVTVQQRHDFCDESWKEITEEACNTMKTVGYLLDIFKDADGGTFITDLDRVKKQLIDMSKDFVRSKKEIDRLRLDTCNDLDILMSKQVDMRAFNKCGYHIGMLEYMVKSDNPEKFKELVRSYGELDINNTRTFGSRYWGSVRNAIRAGHEKTSTVEGVVDLLRSCVANIAQGNGSFIMNEREGLHTSKEAEFLATCGRTTISRLSTDKKTVSIADVISRHIHLLSYDGMTYYPGVYQDEYLNLFRGYSAELIDTPNDDIQVILDHLRDIQCNENIELYNYLIQWLAYVVQKPTKVGTAILMIGKQGVGKTIFWQFFCQKILGMHNSYICPGLIGITSKFNGHLANKRLLLVSECDQLSKHDHTNLKALITDTHITLEDKGKKTCQLHSSHCIAITSNHKDHRFIEEEERRFVVIECSNVKRDSSYFSRLSDIMDDNANDFYSYLMRLDISRFVPSSIPKGKLRQDIEESNINPVQLFLTENRWDDWAMGSEIYGLYRLWCGQKGVDPVHNSKFKIHANNMIESKKIKTGIMYKLSI